MTSLARLRTIAGSLLARPSVRWVVLSLVLTTIIGTAAYSYREINTELTAVALLRRETVAQLAATTLTEKFGRVVDVAISLASRPQVRSLVAEGKWIEAVNFLRTVPRDLPQIDRVVLADTKGTLRADVPALPGVRGKNFAFREWYQGVHREWRPYISPAYQRTAAPRLNVFTASVPIRNEAGHVTGILLLQIRLESLLAWAKTAAGASTSEFINIIDSRGQLVFNTGRSDGGEITDLSAVPVVMKLLRGEHGVEISPDPVEREESIVAYAPVAGYGWGVVTHQPIRSSIGLAARDEQLRRLLTGYGLLLLLGGMTIFLASRVAVARQRAEDDRRMKVELEKLVTERTTELTCTNNTLRGEIAERTRAENRFRDLLESAPDIIVLVDKQGKIVLANSQVERCFGYTRKELIGQSVEILVPEHLRDGHPAHREKYLATPRTRPMGAGLDLYARRKDGSEFPVEISLSTLETAEGMLVTAIVRDVTARKATEEALRNNSAQLDAANKELEAFSYSVSHDLRAPLRSIDGFSQALLEDYPDKLDEQGRNYLARVRAATQRMAELIDDMLQLSRVTRAEIHRETVDLSALADSVVADLRRTEPQRQVEVAIQPNLQAEGDTKLLRIGLVNLLSNAWKFTGRQPAARIEMGALDNGNEHAFFVRDNGVGFDMVYADKLFGAFQRLHAMSEFPGTGIGLATVQRIVHRHGGRVWAEGAVNQGATFYFALPPTRST